MERQYKISEVANIYGVTVQAVYKWIRQDKIKLTES